jgi:DNA-binding NtrC family response regulator
VRGFEVPVRRCGGQVIWMRDTARAVCDQDGYVLYYEGCLEDVTQQKQAELALQESEEQFRRTAKCPDEALALSAGHSGSIDLLITDIVMPGMQGVDLAKQVALSRPGIRVVYISGYTDDIVEHQDEKGLEWAFLQKPFTPSRLASAVRSALDGSMR